MNELKLDYAAGIIAAGTGAAGADGVFLRIRSAVNIDLAFPRFSLRECSAPPEFTFAGQKAERALKNGGHEYTLSYQSAEGLTLEAVVQTFPGSPAIRFRQRLFSSGKVFHAADKNTGEHWEYTRFSLEAPEISEFQFAQFIHHLHSYVPQISPLREEDARFGAELPGPALIFTGGKAAAVIGYEHGATYPDSFLAFSLRREGEAAQAAALQAAIRARKGNVYGGQIIDGDHPFESVWFHLLALEGGTENLFPAYRKYFERFITQNTASRFPHVFYNTWNYQERDHNLRGLSYLENMRQERILAEIDKAHEMGIDIFVLDTGWYGKTGDWLVNLKRFPDGLKAVREKLKAYNMKLGLWFNPTVAARSSKALTEHPEFRMTKNGEGGFYGIWESEESTGMCLASGYWEYLADALINLNKELGVVYFKWDGIGQRGCDSPLHDHGGPENSPQEREECYSYLLGLRMIRAVEKLCEHCPEAIVDFDVTESGRFVGLGFLQAGKYFLVNNGPYAEDFDMPNDYRFGLDRPVKMPGLTNIFFYPGPARPRFCRTGVRYDPFVPSTLFLTHYLPDGNQQARENSLAALVLGGNGIWGSLTELNDEETAFWRKNLALYKQVRAEAASVAAKVTGTTGGSPEIYEKADPETGKGLIVFFSGEDGIYPYVAGPFKKTPEVVGADRVETLEGGYLRITADVKWNGARTVFLLDKN